MTSTSKKPARRSGLGRVVAYYAVLAVLAVLAVRYVPAVRDTISGGRLAELGRGEIAQLLGEPAPPPVTGAGDATPWSGAVLAALSMLGALAIMMPVTWVYMVTRRIRGYHESVVHTLLILPVAVTGIVMIVQNSVALAFSLAGIVAAVRFRTTLEDTKDAVYVFLAIGVGLASGVQELGIALVLSLIFNAVVLVIWYTRFGNIYASHDSGGMTVGDVSAGPASAMSALRVGDPRILEAAKPSDLAEIAERAARVERYLAAERARRKERRANALILVHAPKAGPAEQYVAAVLEELAERHKLVHAGPGPGGGSLLEYLARLDGPGVVGAVRDRLLEGHQGAVSAAEIRSLKGLKPRA